ncbi:MAG: UDP-N-acetylmuramate dehydrogenase, partial [Myxococcales bacterium]|nr:UDP-N-acetylmuramate dehydrogenase [Myxococcales bacterium]
EIIENFDRLMDLMGPDTVLFANGDDPKVMARAARAQGRVITYGFSAGNALRATHVEPHSAGCRFVLERAGHPPQSVESPLAGRHNVWNTLVALGVGLELGAELADLLAALATFKGVKKRQEERGEVAGVLVIDDYAHHPTAIRETLDALRARYPGRRLWAVYEPKSNTARRNIHQGDYATAFAGADLTVLARPFVKRDDFGADERLDLSRLVAEISAHGTPARHTPSVDDAFRLLCDEVRPGDVVVFMSSSGFEGIHDRLLGALAQR